MTYIGELISFVAHTVVKPIHLSGNNTRKMRSTIRFKAVQKTIIYYAAELMGRMMGFARPFLSVCRLSVYRTGSLLVNKMA